MNIELTHILTSIIIVFGVLFWGNGDTEAKEG